MAETYCNSYYAATRNPIAPFPRLDKRIEVDVAIIGGGFTGVATAVELAERGVSVALLEGNVIGWGASSRNGGQITGSLSGDKAMLGRSAPRPRISFGICAGADSASSGTASRNTPSSAT
jgi:ribosomal protein S9